MTVRQVDATKQSAADNNLTGGALSDPEALQSFLDDMALKINQIGADNGDMATLTTTSKITAGAVNELVSGKAAKKTGAETWTAPTLLNAWVNYGGGYATIGYYKDEFNMVRIRGFIKSGTTTPGTTILTLPVGLRPGMIEPRGAVSFNGTSIIPILTEVSTNGNLNIGSISPGSTWLVIDITFRAEQ